MKLKKGVMYLKKEIKNNIKGDDCFFLYKEDGSHIHNLFYYLNDDDELFLKDFYETECIDPIYLNKGKCLVYNFIVPNEVYERAQEKRLQRRLKK